MRPAKNSAVTGCSKMIRSTSTPSKVPVRPRNVLVPPSCLAGSTLNVRSSKYQPVNARAHSRTSCSV